MELYFHHHSTRDHQGFSLKDHPDLGSLLSSKEHLNHLSAPISKDHPDSISLSNHPWVANTTTSSHLLVSFNNQVQEVHHYLDSISNLALPCLV